MNKKERIMLLVAMFSLMIGFASVSTVLYINGTANLVTNETDYDIYYSKAEVDGIVDNTVITGDKEITFTKDFDTVGDTYVLKYNITNGSKNYNTNITMNCTGGNEYISVNNSWVNDTVISATETKTGVLSLEMIKSYIGNDTLKLNVSCTINASATERTESGTGTPEEKVTQVAKKYTIITDNNSNGIADIGDEIEVNSENFYVIKNENGKISALAKYNLMVGNNKMPGIEENKQSEAATGFIMNVGTFCGGVYFSENNGWDYENNNEIDIQQYDGPVKDALNNYKSIVTNAIKIRLITNNELNSMGCSLVDGSCESSSYSWIYSTTYWVGNADSNDSLNVNTVMSNGNIRAYDHTVRVFGVRPVIEIII